MIFQPHTAKLVAEKLLEIEAVRLSVDEPFIWASGWRSPIYCDNRKTLAYPSIRKLLRTSFVELIQEKFPSAEGIAGVATAGIPHGMMIADAMDLPFAYVRSKPKEHGMGNQIEGLIRSKQKIVVVEDLISTGKSSLSAVERLRGAGVDVLGLVAIFTYGFSKADDAFKQTGCSYWTLSGYDQLLQVAQASGYVGQDQMETLNNWRKQPESW